MINFRSNLFLLIPATILVLGCSNSGDSSNANVKTNSTKSQYFMSHTKSYDISVGAAKIYFSEIKICKENDFYCVTALMVFDKNKNLVKQLNSQNQYDIKLEDISPATFQGKAKETPEVSESVAINVNEANTNFSSANHVALSQCRSTKIFQRMSEINTSKRNNFYFHWADDNLKSSRIIFKANAETGDVSAVSTEKSFDSFHVTETSPRLVINANDENGELFTDNALIVFEYHFYMCENTYESLMRTYPQPMSKEADLLASELMEDDFGAKMDPKLMGTFGPKAERLDWPKSILLYWQDRRIGPAPEQSIDARNITQFPKE